MKKLILGSLVILAAGIPPLFAGPEKTLPPAIYSRLKNGGKLDRIWINPKYDVASGFTIGRVDTLAEGLYANTVEYFPTTLQRLAVPGSINVLNVTVTNLTTLERPTLGVYGATMEVEGSVVDRDGQVMFAFSTRQEVTNMENVKESCRAIMDQIAWAIFKDLGKRFQEAHQLQEKAAFGNSSGLLPPGPAQPRSLTVGERLIELDNLRKNGLITEEDFNKHKEEILKGM
jgi:hypothetical protein